MERTYEQRLSFKEKRREKRNSYTQHQEAAIKISRIHKEEIRLRKFDTHRLNSRATEELAPNVSNERVEMDGGECYRRINKKTTFINCYKGIWHAEDERCRV